MYDICSFRSERQAGGGSELIAPLLNVHALAEELGRFGGVDERFSRIYTRTE
jgi:hypothetical protein